MTLKRGEIFGEIGLKFRLTAIIASTDSEFVILTAAAY